MSNYRREAHSVNSHKLRLNNLSQHNHYNTALITAFVNTEHLGLNTAMLLGPQPGFDPGNFQGSMRGVKWAYVIILVTVDSGIFIRKFHKWTYGTGGNLSQDHSSIP